MKKWLRNLLVLAILCLMLFVLRSCMPIIVEDSQVIRIG